MVIAVDFDGTLSLGRWPEVGPVNRGLMDFLMKRKLEGDKIILWTCRAGEELIEAVHFCKENGLIFDAINANLPEVVEYFGNNSRKISCDIYIDDKSLKEHEYTLLGDASQ